MGEEDTGTSFSLLNLFCREDECCLNGGEEEEEEESDVQNAKSERDPNLFMSEDEESEYVCYLVGREKLWFGTSLDTTPFYPDWLKSARLGAIDWIFNTRANLDFQYRTAYLSICYLDRFLSIRSIQEGNSWSVQLLSVACLAIAAKMEECNVPPLSEFPTENYVFESKVIQRMELLVLNTLDWKMDLITPFSYIHFFINKVIRGEPVPERLISKAVEFISATTKEMNLMDCRPSVVAAAASLAAFDSKLTKKDLEVMFGLISSWVCQKNGCVFQCYHLMQKIEMGRNKPLQPATGESSCIEPEPAAKRQLYFDDCEENFLENRAHHL